MIQKVKLGKIEDVLEVQFGTGDIMFHGIESTEIPYGLAFCQMPAREIGATTQEFNNMPIDELPSPARLIMTFTRPESITALVHSLIELQKKMIDAPPTEKPND